MPPQLLWEVNVLILSQTWVLSPFSFPNRQTLIQGDVFSAPACPEGQISANPKDCSGYFECKNEKLVPFTCPLDYHFSISEFTCLKPRDAGCEPSRECTLLTRPNSTRLCKATNFGYQTNKRRHS